MATEPAVSGPAIEVVDSPAAGAALAAERIADALQRAVQARGRADWATSGGSTPVGIYQHLSTPPLVDRVPWADVHVWWGDDRYVPRDHPASNVKAFDDIMLAASADEEGTAGTHGGHVIPLDNLHPFLSGEAIGAERGAASVASALAAELRAAPLERVGGWPVFDLIIVGVGADGHVLSVFPGSAALDSDELALAIPAPTHIEPHLERVTLNPAVLGVAREVLVAAFGADKAPVIASVLGTEHDARRWPAQLAAREGATWILDAASASRLDR
jgi:6-phosphogluconolactonase